MLDQDQVGLSPRAWRIRHFLDSRGGTIVLFLHLLAGEAVDDAVGDEDHHADAKSAVECPGHRDKR